METRIVAVIVLTISCAIAYFLWLTISHFAVNKMTQDGIVANGRMIRSSTNTGKDANDQWLLPALQLHDRTGITHECKSMVPA